MVRLTLLPSGPDVVREIPLRKTKALRPDLKKDIKMAESERFELSIQVSPYTRFPGVLLQPLGQLSTMLYQRSYSVVLPRLSAIAACNNIYLTIPKCICQQLFYTFIKKSPQKKSAEIDR